MLQGLIVVAQVLAARSGGTARDQRGYEGSPSRRASAQTATETIDGMLYVGMRPSTRGAA